MRAKVLGAIAPVVLLTACGGGDPAAVVDAVRATEQSQLESIASKDLVGIARLYADDAHLVRPDGSVIDGAVAIVEEYGNLVEDPNFNITIEPRDGWGSASEDLAVLSSSIQFTTTDPATGNPVTQPMESVMVWTRDTGGTWKIVSAYNVGQGAVPAAAGAAAAAGAGTTGAEAAAPAAQ